jgi:4-amino-4-deoxy-L-arabinose transferase-like glycosyltransferase
MFTKLLSKDYRYHLHLLIAAGAFFFLPFLGLVHLFDWDEINFAESAREMLVTNNYTQVQINFKPFWEKPPFFFWLQALSMKAFGINAFASRLPNALFGILTLVVFYLIGKKIYDGRFGFLWAISYLGSFLPHLYFKSAIIDPVFNFFIFLSIYFLFQTIQNYKQPKGKYLALLAGCYY